MLEACKRWGLDLYCCQLARLFHPPLAQIKVTVKDRAFTLADDATAIEGLTARGISEAFTTAAPVSLYGATKLASEAMALEYGEADFPVRINRWRVSWGGTVR